MLPPGLVRSVTPLHLIAQSHRGHRIGPVLWHHLNRGKLEGANSSRTAERRCGPMTVRPLWPVGPVRARSGDRQWKASSTCSQLRPGLPRLCAPLGCDRPQHHTMAGAEVVAEAWLPGPRNATQKLTSRARHGGRKRGSGIDAAARRRRHHAAIREGAQAGPPTLRRKDQGRRSVPSEGRVGRHPLQTTQRLVPNARWVVYRSAEGGGPSAHRGIESAAGKTRPGSDWCLWRVGPPV